MKVLDYENIILKKEANVATITLNRPRVLNAVNQKMAEEILDAIDDVIKNDDARVLVITGAGRGFCAGDDLNEWHDTSTLPADYSKEYHRRRNHLIIRAIRNIRIPVVAAVNGNAHGLGADMMLACDFRIASEDAKFGDIRAKHALTVGDGSTYLLPKLVGLSKAIELLFFGDMIDAQEAERIGLVNRTVPVVKFEAEVMELADRLAHAPTRVIGGIKAAIYRESNMSLEEALEDAVTEAFPATPIEDSIEGLRAFLEKRPPNYTGK